MNIKRLLVAGTVGAGKSTFVRTIDAIGTVGTEEIATDKTADLKLTTTVAIDFCRVALPTGTVHVYGAPGQARFQFMWDILIARSHLLLVLVAAHRPAEFDRSRQILNFMQTRSPLVPLIGLTHTDCPDALTAATVLPAIAATPLPIITVNPLDRTSVLNALAIVTQAGRDRFDSPDNMGLQPTADTVRLPLPEARHPTPHP